MARGNWCVTGKLHNKNYIEVMSCKSFRMAICSLCPPSVTENREGIQGISVTILFGREESMKTGPHIADVRIEDDLSTQDQGAIEVHLQMSSGENRWCYFMTPRALQACGNWIEGTTVRFHYGAPHMIVVADVLTDDLIRKALRSIEESGEVLVCTRAVDDRNAEQTLRADGEDAAAQE